VVEPGRSEGSHPPRGPAAVVRVPVREAHGSHAREPDAEPTRVLQPDLGRGSDVEEDRALFGAAPPRDQRRETLAGEAQMSPGLYAVMAVLGRKMGNTRDQSPELGKLRHTFIHAG